MKEERSTIRVTIDCSKDGMTQQNFKDECDINCIVEKAMRTGLITHYNDIQAVYADCTDVPDFQSAKNIVLEAEAVFNSLNAKTRERFNNDPGMLLEFISKKENRDEAITLGLIEKPIEAPQMTAGTEGK